MPNRHCPPLEFSVRIFPVCHNAQSVKAAVVNPKVLRYGSPRSEQDAAIDCDLVEDEVPTRTGERRKCQRAKEQLWSVAIAFAFEVSNNTAPSGVVSYKVLNC